MKGTEMKRAKILFVMLAAMLLTICVTPVAHAYSISVKNETGCRVSGIFVFYLPYRHDFGTFAVGATQSYATNDWKRDGICWTEFNTGKELPLVFCRNISVIMKQTGNPCEPYEYVDNNKIFILVN